MSNQLPTVKVEQIAKDQVAKFVVGTKWNIGQFFTEAALEKLNKELKKRQAAS